MKTKKIILECGCTFHKIELEISKYKNINFLDISIYEHKSMQTGKSFKKTKLLADIALSQKDLIQLKKWINNE